MKASERTRNPFIAAVLSLVAPGVGQIYNGKGALGLLFFLIFVALPFLGGVSGWLRHFIGLAAFAFLAAVFWLFTFVHAFVQAHRSKEAGRKKYQTTPVYAFFIVLSLGLMFLVPAIAWRTLLGVAPFRFMTDSMMPTIQQGDFLMSDPNAYENLSPQRGDLVVFDYPKEPTRRFLMRVIAVEGETVEIKDRQVQVDGESLHESYKTQADMPRDKDRDNFGPLKIPAGHCFVLGDNRDNSNDSRFWGTLPFANVKGRALYIYWAKDKKRIGLTPK
jgi:signal peptidase I